METQKNIEEKFSGTTIMEESAQSDFSKETQADVSLELPDIQISMSKSAVDILQNFQTQDKKSRKKGLISITMMFIMMILFIIAIIFLNQIMTEGKLMLILILIITIPTLIGAANGSKLETVKKNAQEFFENSFLLDELKQYVEKPSIKKNIYPSNNSVESKNKKLLSPGEVLEIVKLGKNEYNQSSLPNWISGRYHKMRFRFFETQLCHNDYSNNNYSTDKVIYEGQGYVFKTPVHTPFEIEYRYSNSQKSELTLENFEKIFLSGRIMNIDGNIIIYPKKKLNAQEMQVINRIETPEFKACLIKLAKIFKTLCEAQDLDVLYDNLGIHKNKLSKGWSVRLQNNDLIILKDGIGNYFNINIKRNMEETLNQYNQEMTEFISVLDTMSKLTAR